MRVESEMVGRLFCVPMTWLFRENLHLKNIGRFWEQLRAKVKTFRLRFMNNK